MRPVRISGALPKPIGAPADWSEETHGHCAALFVRHEIIDGLGYMRSAWEVEANEALMLFGGAKITLGLSAPAHPVVQMNVAELPADFDPVVCARRLTRPDGTKWVRVEMLFPQAGGRRGYMEIEITSTLAAAVAQGVEQIEALARKNGWAE